MHPDANHGDLTAGGAGICVVVQFLCFVDGLWPFWEGLARDLESQGQSLVILSPHAPPQGVRWPPVLPIPYAIGAYTPSAVDASRPHWPALLETDWAFHSPTHPPAPAVGVETMASAQALVDALLDHLQPDVVLAWAPPFPQSRLLLQEARWREIPAFGMERGFLPGTLGIDTQDVGFGSDLICHPVLRSAALAHGPDERLLSALRAHAGVAAPAAAPAGAAAGGAPVVTLLGSCPGFNLQPRQSRLIELASPWFSSFAEACECLADALPPGARLRARPHQADVDGRRYCETSPRVEAARDVALADLIAQSDLVAVVGGTRTQYDAVLAERPVLTLTRGPLWGAGVAYEFEGQALDALVTRALARDDWAPRLEAGRRLVSFLARHALFGFDGTPVPRGRRDLADFLGRFRRPRSSDRRPSEAVDGFIRATAPLLVDFVDSELHRGARAPGAWAEPYLEAALARAVARAGIARVVLYGAGAVGERLTAFLGARGVQVTAVVDRAWAVRRRMPNGLDVRDPDSLGALQPEAVVLASHAHESAMRRHLEERRIVPPLGVWGIVDYPARHAR